MANIRTRRNNALPMYVTWDEGDVNGMQRAMAATANDLENINHVVNRNSQRALAYDSYLNVSPNISVREGFARRDYDWFRPDEMMPMNHRHLIGASMRSYDTVDIVHNTIDLMSDFACQGITLVHPNPRIEQLHREWAKKIGFKERSERFVSTLLRAGSIVIKRDTAKLTATQLDQLRRGLGEADIEPPDPPPVLKNELPLNYTYYNPLLINILGGDELAQFTGVSIYAINVPNTISGKIKNPRSEEEKWLVNQLPPYIVDQVRSGKKSITLDPNKISAFFYKKDDWQLWGKPLVAPILDNLMLYSKMKLADLSALDGAISHIRLWRLGDLEKRILPTPALIKKLADILVNATSGGAIDLIWGPELDVKETSTDIYRFLGSEKYGSVLAAIFNGLGIPTSLQSGSRSGGGSNMNQYISLKTMTERLKYIRDILVMFWEYELRLFQRALGLRQPAKLKFDFMVFTDEEAYRKLLIDLADRDLISIQTLLEHFGEIPEVELIRIKREHKARQSGKMRKKAGPYHNPQIEDDLTKIFATSGIVSPSESGIELGDKEKGQLNLMEWKIKVAKAQADAKSKLGVPSPTNPLGNQNQDSEPPGLPGRPKGVKDTAPRKQKKLSPKVAANYFTMRAWARETQEVISKIVNPIYLESCAKRNMRSLTDEEAQRAEDFKFAVLCSLQPHEEFNVDKLKTLIDNNSLRIPQLVNELMVATIDKYFDKFGRKPIIDDIRLFQAEAYSLWNSAAV